MSRQGNPERDVPEAPAGRRCGTCRHFEPSSSWKRGWCRNTLLFAPGQSHEVQSEELDCSRGSGDFWEPPNPASNEPLENAGQPIVKLPNISSPLKLFSPAPAQPALGVAGAGGTMMFASGGGGGDYDPDDFDQYDDVDEQPAPPQRRPRATRSSGGRDTTGGRPRTTQFQPEERFWTDYLRIALPVIGLLLLIGLLWFWADALINDEPGPSEQVSTETLGEVISSTPTAPAATEPLVVATPPPSTGNETNAGETTTTPEEETTSGGDNQTSEPEATEPPVEEPASGDTFADGDTIVLSEEVNLRPDPTTEGDPIEVLDAGSTLTITGGPVEGDSYTWWEVATEDGNIGWVAEGDYMELAG